MHATQHPTTTDILRAPKGTPIEECKALPITRITYSDGSEAIASYWQPSDLERALIAVGAPVRLIVLGKGQPPVKLGVAGDDEEGKGCGL